MGDGNKRNIHYFESTSMRELYERMHDWQVENNKRFLSIEIQESDSEYCCIALTNPSEMVITNIEGTRYVGVKPGGRLEVCDN